MQNVVGEGLSLSASGCPWSEEAFVGFTESSFQGVPDFGRVERVGRRSRRRRSEVVSRIRARCGRRVGECWRCRGEQSLVFFCYYGKALRRSSLSRWYLIVSKFLFILAFASAHQHGWSVSVVVWWLLLLLSRLVWLLLLLLMLLCLGRWVGSVSRMNFRISSSSSSLRLLLLFRRCRERGLRSGPTRSGLVWVEAFRRGGADGSVV